MLLLSRRSLFSGMTALAFCCLLLFGTVALMGCRAQAAAEDMAEGEGGEGQAGNVAQETDSEQPEMDSSAQIGPSPDVQTSFLFTNLEAGPSGGLELMAGQIVKFLVGLANKGEKDLVVQSCETSFRYPLDFNYHIQNFSAARYERMVQPKEEATFDYAFIPSDAFIGRPLGLVVNLHYVDTDGQYFVSAVFNETVTIVEDESGFNHETYFVYLILAAFVIVLVLIGQHFLSKYTRGGGSGGSKSGGLGLGRSGGGTSAQHGYETGTNKNDVDFEWIPRSHLEKKSPKLGSPRNRKQPAAAKPSSSATSSS